MAHSKLDTALGLAAQGFRVFPLIPDGKLPAIKDWPNKATTDTKTLKKWFENSDKNIGIATGHGLVVLDVDVKNGKNGAESLKRLDLIHELPDTFTVTTPTGGTHVYLSTDASVRNSASTLGDGLDVRGHNGFVVAPGSTIGGKAYTVRDDRQVVAQCPSTLAKQFGVPAEHKLGSQIVSRVELDSPSAQQRAAQYLSRAEPAIEGAGGDHHTFKVAAAVKDFGISEETAFELMGLLWNDRCQPPWQPEELQTKIHNAYKHGTKPPGIKDPSMDFEPIPQAKSRLFRKKFKDAALDRDRVPLLEDYLDKHAFSVLYGDSNVGKTFIAMDLAFHIAAGKPWNGKAVEQGPVIYLATEGGKAAENRMLALRKHYGLADVPLDLIPCPVDLLRNKDDIAGVLGLIDEAALDYGQPVAMIVVDTLSRAMAGGDENSSEAMGTLIKNLDRMRASSNAHIMVVHHSGKNAASGARGHSSLRAATDTELEVADGALTVKKQRDMEFEPARAFALKAVVVGEDRRGKQVTSCVVRWAQAGDDFCAAPVTKDEANILEAVKAAVETAGAAGKDGVSVESVFDAYRDMGHTLTHRTVRRGLVALETKGSVRRSGANRWAKWNVA